MCTTLTARNSVRLCGTHQIYIYRRALKSATGADNGSRKSHGSGTTGNIPRALGGIISLRLPRIYVQHVILNLSLLHTLLKFLSNPLASPEIGIGAFGYIHNIQIRKSSAVSFTRQFLFFSSVINWQLISRVILQKLNEILIWRF